MHLSILFALTLLYPQAAKQSCWIDVGMKPEYASGDQVRDLRRQVQNTRCEVIVLAWRIRPLPERESVLVWDSKLSHLYRLHVGPQPTEVRWEKWAAATTKAILADDPSDGFDLGPYSDGKGRTGMSSAAIAFVHKNAPRMRAGVY